MRVYSVFMPVQCAFKRFSNSPSNKPNSVGSLTCRIFSPQRPSKSSKITRHASQKKADNQAHKDLTPMNKPKPSTESESLSWRSQLLTKATVVTVLVFAVGAGIWLNNTAWRNRKLFWQLQAALIGGGVGFVTGRLSR